MTAPRPRVRAGSRAARTRARLAVAYRQGDTEIIPTLQRELQIDMAVDYLQELRSVRDFARKEWPFGQSG